MTRLMRDPEWQRARIVALERDGYSCQVCRHNLRGELDVHHRMPRSLRLDHSPSNLITLCDAHHASVHLNLQVSLAKRTIQRWAVRIARLVDRHGDLPPGELDLTPVLAALQKTALLPGQLPVILAILRGESVLAVRPTGSGKSICFQIPTLLRPGHAVVIEPLRVLMKDQVRSLHDVRVPATFVNGEISHDERAQRYELLQDGAWKFLYLAPERFDSTRRHTVEQKLLDEVRPSFLVIDEAHSIVQYGDGFRPSYAKLGEIRERLGRPAVLAFTATANKATQKAICDSLDAPDARVIVEDPDRPNITLIRHAVPRDNPSRYRTTRRLLAARDGGKAIIFVPTVRIGIEVQKGLAAEGLALEFFHADAQSSNWRDVTQGRFEGRLDPPIDAIIATSAFGMGLDIPNVRLVVSWQHPFSVEEFVQAFGRAGRDGQPSITVLFVDRTNDAPLLRWMIDREPGADKVRRLQDLDAIERIANNRTSCFRTQILDALDAPTRARPPLAVRILEWAFRNRKTKQINTPCCDHCEDNLLRQLLANTP